MGAKAVQFGSSRITFSDEDISRALLVVGVGVLTYETVSKAVQKIAGETMKYRLVPLAASTSLVIFASAMKLPRLQGKFIFLCVLYVVVSIWTRNPFKTSSLPDYMVDMVAEAKRGAYLSKIGYEEAMSNVEILMNKKTKPNAILLGNPGVGKSTILETIAYKIATAQYPLRSVFFGAKLISVDFTDLMAGTIYRGMLEQRVKEMIQLAKKDPKIIYFIDEIHKFVGAGQTIESKVDVSEMFLPVLARGEIRVIGASTNEDYARCIQPKRALARRFPQVVMDEPTHAQCFLMLQHSYGQTSGKERIKISDHAIAAAIFFTKDIPQRFFPDKAVDLIDAAVSYAELHGDTENDLILTERHIAEVLCLNCSKSNVNDLVLLFKGAIILDFDYFPGLVDNEVDGLSDHLPGHS